MRCRCTVIASAHVAHYANALACVRHGCPVLVEKPMTTTATEAAQLLSEAKAHGAEVSVNNTNNFNSHTDQAAELVASGVLGAVRHVVCLMAGDLRDLFGSSGMKVSSSHRSSDQVCTRPRLFICSCSNGHLAVKTAAAALFVAATAIGSLKRRCCCVAACEGKDQLLPSGVYMGGSRARWRLWLGADVAQSRVGFRGVWAAARRYLRVRRQKRRRGRRL